MNVYTSWEIRNHMILFSEEFSNRKKISMSPEELVCYFLNKNYINQHYSFSWL